jgi:hypothetical protein
MKASLNCSQGLPGKGVTTFWARAGETIRCDAGSLWITQDGDPRDVVLDAGDSFETDRDGSVTISAFAESVIARDTRHSTRAVGLCASPTQAASSVLSGLAT